jgi:hypothetical protein
MYNPQTHLAIARDRHADMIREVERGRLARSFVDERPGVFSRLRTHLSRRREAEPRPVAV